MDINKAYQKFTIKINKNATTDSISCDKGRFAIILNESQNKFQEFILDKKGDDEIRYIQHLLVEDYLISSSNPQKDSQDFPLPKNYFDISSVHAESTKGNCTKQKIDLFEIKNDDRNNILSDEFNKPSFKYREAPYNLTSNKIKVYKEDFEIENLVLSYYRYAKQVELQDSEDPESDFKNTSLLEWEDKIADRIISLTASEFELNNGSEKYQANKLNSAQKI